jgi:hypothetical protein
MSGTNIVQVNVSLQQAPLPSTLQQTGAFISQGATHLASQGPILSNPITQMSDLLSIIAAPGVNSSLTWTGGVVTATTAGGHGYTIGDQINLSIAGATPVAYNGFHLATITGASTYTYSLPTNPGTSPATTPGTYTPEDVSELIAMGTTYFAQGSAQAVYVLELGLGSVTEGVATLTTYLDDNPQQLYAVLVPRIWDVNSAFLALIASYESPTSLFYFYVTTTEANYTQYTALMKDVVTMIEAPGNPVTEFSLAAAFYRLLSQNPGPTNKLPPFAFAQQFGVTPYPTAGNGSLLTSLKAAGVNVIRTGAEGGLTNTYLYWGTTMDGRDIAYWYSIDWVQIQSQIALANEVINGSNTPLNPLYYDQFGINRLQAREAGVMTNAVTFGLATGTVIQTEFDGNQLAVALDNDTFVNQCVVNAVPFVSYATALPSDYRVGKYGGLAVVFIVNRGFTLIVLNIVATDFVTF